MAQEITYSAKFKRDYVAALAVIIFFAIVLSEIALAVSIPVYLKSENTMSGFVCPDCKSRHDLFGTGGGARLAEKSGVPLLARVPLDPAFLKECDYGELPAGLEKSAAVREELEKVVQALI